MGDLHLATQAPRIVPAHMIDEWSHLLLEPERIAFVGACTEAGAGTGADGEFLQPMLGRYFSTWKTSLMGGDLSRLQLLATTPYARIRDCIKVICLEDDLDELELIQPPEPSAICIWPRLGDRRVAGEALGVGLGLLKAMLASQQLRPDKLQITDKGTCQAPSDPETAAILARNILDGDGVDLAVTAFTLQKESYMTTIITAELSAAHQGQGMRFSLLRTANIMLSHILNPYSYWVDQVLCHAPALKELSLSFWQPQSVSQMPPFVLDLDDENKAWPALEKLEICTARLSAASIMAILSKSAQSLTGISFRLTTLDKSSTWRELLSRIGNDFPHLKWFKLIHLSERPIPSLQISFLDLEKDERIIEPYKAGLKTLRKLNAAGNPRIALVEYEGLDASHVLKIVAECAVAKPFPC